MTAPRLGLGALRGRRILVVEDDALIALSLVDLLAESGAVPVGPAPTVRAALAALDAERPDAAVLDVNLRGECSAPVARALLGAGVPFVLTTGYARSQLDEPELCEAPIVPKPVNERLLMEWLARLLLKP